MSQDIFITALDLLVRDADRTNKTKLKEVSPGTDLSGLPYLWWSRWQKLYKETKGHPYQHGPWSVCNIDDQWIAAQPEVLRSLPAKGLNIRFHKRFDVVGLFDDGALVLVVNEKALLALGTLTEGLGT